MTTGWFYLSCAVCLKQALEKDSIKTQTGCPNLWIIAINQTTNTVGKNSAINHTVKPPSSWHNTPCSVSLKCCFFFLNCPMSTHSTSETELILMCRHFSWCQFTFSIRLKSREEEPLSMPRNLAGLFNGGRGKQWGVYKQLTLQTSAFKMYDWSQKTLANFC